MSNLKPFVIDCAWLDIRDAIHWGTSAEGVVRSVLASRGIHRFWAFGHIPAETADEVDSWYASFESQSWGNGDFNIESIYAEEPTMDRVALPC